jgi:hypothetical protein
MLFVSILLENPGSYQSNGSFLWDEFEVFVIASSIGGEPASIGWTKRKIRWVAKGRNADLRDPYLQDLSEFHSYYLVYIDEPGCDKRVGFRQTGWSLLGTTPVQIT